MKLVKNDPVLPLKIVNTFGSDEIKQNTFGSDEKNPETVGSVLEIYFTCQITNIDS